MGTPLHFSYSDLLQIFHQKLSSVANNHVQDEWSIQLRTQRTQETLQLATSFIAKGVAIGNIVCQILFINFYKMLL
jgi:hypothetical protein